MTKHYEQISTFSENQRRNNFAKQKFPIVNPSFPDKKIEKIIISVNLKINNTYKISLHFYFVNLKKLYIQLYNIVFVVDSLAVLPTRMYNFIHFFAPKKLLNKIYILENIQKTG